MTAILTATIDTPHPVYGLQWSADGERLALCGGFLYGGGFVGLADRSGQLLTLRDQASLTAEPLLDGADVILSSVCIDDRGRWLLAAACSYKWDARGPLLFRIDGDRLELVAAPELTEEEDDDAYHSGHATGAWLHRGRMLVRYRARELAEALLTWPAPEELHADESRAHLCNARITIADDVVWIAKNLLHVYSSAGTGPPMVPGSDARLIYNPHGLASLDLRDPSASLRLQPLDHDERCTAIVRDRAGARIFTGLADHRIVEWRVVDRERLERTGVWRHGSDARNAPVVRGIQALCMLADGETLVSAELGGSIALWRDGEAVGELRLPRPWSPRALAAHPSEPWIAIGCKGRGGYEPGTIFVYDLSPLVAPG